MGKMLSPGGKMVVANFTPKLQNIAYMEAFMDWQLIYRGQSDMLQLMPETPDFQSSTRHDPSQSIVLLEVLRKRKEDD
jgi:hypothetical protein